MAIVDFSTVRALTFDCYGTLIDWETGLLNTLRPWADREGVALSDDALLAAYSQIEPIVQTEMPSALYPSILRDVMRRLASRLGGTATADDCDALAKSVGDWPAFSDSTDALARLKRRYKLVIVSNVDRASFVRSNARIGVAFDAIVTAEDVGSYKPATGHFEHAFAALSDLGVHRSEILHVAESLYHDHVPAKALGMPTAWIRRRVEGSSRATRAPALPIEPDMTFATMAAFAEAALT